MGTIKKNLITINAVFRRAINLGELGPLGQ